MTASRTRLAALPALALCCAALTACGSSSHASSGSHAPKSAPATASTSAATPPATATTSTQAAAAQSSPSTADTSVPAGTVATVGGTPITTASFNHWLTVIVYSNAASSKVTPVVPDPPAYTGCIAEARKEPKLAKASTASLKDNCEELDKVDASEVLDFLIKSIWLENEAKKTGDDPSSAAVTLNFNHEKQQEFKSAAAFQQFLQESRQTTADIMLRIKTSRIESVLAKKDGGDQQLVTKLTGEYKPTTHCAAAYAMQDCAGYSPAAASQEGSTN